MTATAQVGSTGNVIAWAGRRDRLCRWADGSRHDEEEKAAGGDDQPSGAGCLGEVVGGDACGEAACDGDADG